MNDGFLPEKNEKKPKFSGFKLAPAGWAGYIYTGAKCDFEIFIHKPNEVRNA